MHGSRITDLLAAIRAARAPSGVATRIVAIDGLGGSGKSSLARHLGGDLEAQIVQTDDFASWDNPLDWWPALIEQVLDPLAADAVASFVPTSWGGPRKSPVTIRPGGLVLMEGVTASRAAFRPYLALAVWVETPRAVRLRRGLERDGPEALAQWEQWMADEDCWVDLERPAEGADFVIRGDAGLWT